MTFESVVTDAMSVMSAFPELVAFGMGLAVTYWVVALLSGASSQSTGATIGRPGEPGNVPVAVRAIGGGAAGAARAVGVKSIAPKGRALGGLGAAMALKLYLNHGRYSEAMNRAFGGAPTGEGQVINNWAVLEDRARRVNGWDG